MSYLPGSHGQRDPYDLVPQYGSAGGSGGQPVNPLMYNFSNRGGGNTQATDKLNLRKQGNPTMLASNSQPTYTTGDYQQMNYQSGTYYQAGYDPRYARPQAQSVYQTAPTQHVHEHQESPHPVSAPPSQPAKLSQVAAAAGVAKVPVESETEYPKPHRGGSLLGIFFTDPSKFEEYVSAKMEALIRKKMHERVVPFKVEMGSMIESLGRANSEEVSGLNEEIKNIEMLVKGQDKVVTSLCDKYQVITSQIQLLESSGVKQSNEDEQHSNLQKIRENMKAEATLVMNERVKEEIGQLEERLGKRFEELEKRSRVTEKKIEAEKADSEAQKGQYLELSAKLEDIGKLVAELTVSGSKQNKEEINFVKQSISNITKYREEDQKKLETIQTHVEENKRQNIEKLSSLEKFMLTLKETTEKAATQSKPQSQVEASLNLMEDVRTLVGRTDNLTYKFDALSYDLNLIKSDIVRQQRSQQGYFEKVDKLEKRIDTIPLGTSMHIGSKNAFNTSNTNFMANVSTRTIDDHNYHRILAPDGHSKQSTSTNEQTNVDNYVQRTSVAKNFFMDDEQFAGNLSIIDKGDQSGMMDEDIFTSSHGGRGTSVGAPSQAINFERKSEGRYMESIPEEEFENDRSKTRPSHGAAKAGPPAPQPIGLRGHQQFGTVLGVQTAITTIGLTRDLQMLPPQQTSNFQPSESPPKPSKVTSQPTSKTGSNFGRLPSLGDGPNNSMLNQSLNSSIRIQKSILQKMDQSIVLGPGNDANESSIIELNIDENGFLVDENGFPILNDKGEPMKLTDDNIDFLKENGLYEEVEIESGN